VCSAGGAAGKSGEEILSEHDPSVSHAQRATLPTCFSNVRAPAQSPKLFGEIVSGAR
jgi:hypothetical protein